MGALARNGLIGNFSVSVKDQSNKSIESIFKKT